MTVLVVVLLLVVCGLIGYLIRQSTESPAAGDVDPEQAMKAAVELHRISRRLDVARLKHEQRCDAARAKREITEALDNDGP
jgi:hypothetical protein